MGVEAKMIRAASPLRRGATLAAFTFAAIVIAGCTSTADLIARDEAECRSYGFAEGTREFSDCKVLLAHARYLKAEARAERLRETRQAMQLSDLERRQRQLEYQQRWLEQQQRNMQSCIDNRRINPSLVC